MIDKTSSLTIIHDDNSVMSDYSHKMSVYDRDAVTLPITSSEDYIYIGFKKPINASYINITTQAGTEGSLNLEYWNGSIWASVSNLSDDTYGLYRSGFIRWDRELTNQVKNEVNSISKYWYRITLAQDRENIEVKGWNLVFSDDYELSLEQPYISDSEFLGNNLSHIKTHAAVKKQIIQKFRNQNYIKYNKVTGKIEDITIWDLLDIDEVRLAATYLALSKIYYQLSDNPEDDWNRKSLDYEDKFNQYIKVARLSIDIDDDGLASPSENKPLFKSTTMRR